MWTEFFDMHSGGSKKTEWEKICIELEEDEAVEYFKKRFNIDPHNVTCDCCGSDFSVDEEEEEHIKNDEVLIITRAEIVSNSL